MNQSYKTQPELELHHNFRRTKQFIIIRKPRSVEQQDYYSKGHSRTDLDQEDQPCQ